VGARVRAEDMCGTAEGEKINADPISGKLKEAKPKVKVGGVDGPEEEDAVMLGGLLCPRSEGNSGSGGPVGSSMPHGSGDQSRFQALLCWPEGCR
jgi:hypothetical protein